MKENILVVDDEDIICDSMSVALKMAGYKVETAKNGQEAFDKIMNANNKKKAAIDLIVTDILMPNVNGLELIENIHDNKISIPVIVISGDSDKNTVVKLLRKGCADYLDKPFEPEDLVRSVKNVFGKQHIQTNECKCMQEKISSNQDAMIGIPERELLHSKLSLTLDSARKNEQKFAILFLGLDRFNKINSNLGHHIGHKLIEIVKKRLKRNMRKKETIAHLCSDEFVILIPQIKNYDCVTKIAKRILRIFDQSILIEDHEIFISCSIGVSIYPDNGEEPEVLMKNAYSAMYSAKKSGGNNFQFYKLDMNVQSFKRLILENRLRKALKQNEFVVHYQPLVDLSTGIISGMEALIRWNCPGLGLISPNEFIPIAEETGMIRDIGDWVLRTACEENKKLQKAGHFPLSLSVNLSARQFQQKILIESITQILYEIEFDPELLVLELTENVLLENIKEAIDILSKIKSIGIKIAMDDFGVGYSSLRFLKCLPINILKIDRTFLHDLECKKDDAVIIKAIIEMAHGLNYKVVAEGVTKKEQVRFLQEHKCDLMQGFYFSPPLPADEFNKLLHSKKKLKLTDPRSMQSLQQLS